EAIEKYGQAITLDSNDAEIHNNLAVAYSAQRNLGKAAEQYRQAIQLKPDSARAHYNLGTLLQLQDDRSAAQIEYADAIRLRPDYAAAHFSLAKVLEGSGKLRDALAHFRTSWELDPQNMDSLSAYERLLEVTKQSATPGAAAN
ncbi:MAG: tetratricopeptide repeat protein, partial [Terriglobia bacterium]